MRARFFRENAIIGKFTLKIIDNHRFAKQVNLGDEIALKALD